MAKNHSNDPEKFSYLVDGIIYLKTLSIAPKMIYYYQHNQLSQSNKLELLSATSQLVNNYQKETATKDTSRVNYIKAVQHFFKQVLLSADNQQVLRQAILLYPIITPPEQAEKAVRNARNRALDIFNHPILTDNEVITQQVALALSTKDMQSTLLKSLLISAENRSMSYQKKLTYTLLFFISYMQTSQISSKNLPLLNYLIRHKPSYHIITENQPAYNTTVFRWLEAYSKVKFDKKIKAEKYITKVIMSTNNINELSALIVGADDYTLNRVNHKRLISIQMTLKLIPIQSLLYVERLAIDRLYSYMTFPHKIK